MKKLLVTVDSLRSDHIQYMDNTTEFLEFEDKNTFATAASTYPSFPAILSGEYTSENGVDDTIASEFDIPTIGISTNHFLSARYGFDTGFDYFTSPSSTSSANWKSRVGNLLEPGSFKHKTAIKLWSKAQKIKTKIGYNIQRDYRSAESVIDEFKSQSKDHNEWFSWLHFMEPHHPYNAPNSDISRQKAKRISRNVISGNSTNEEEEIVKRLYKKEVTWLDSVLENLWEFIPEETEVIFCADHGEYLGEDNNWGHGEDLVPELLKVPLGYKNIQNRPVGNVMSLIDIPSVLCEEEYKNGLFDRDIAYATVNNKKAVFMHNRYINENGTFDYDRNEVKDRKLRRLYSNFSSRSPSRISEGVEDDLEALGYI